MSVFWEYYPQYSLRVVWQLRPNIKVTRKLLPTGQKEITVSAGWLMWKTEVAHWPFGQSHAVRGSGGRLCASEDSGKSMQTVRQRRPTQRSHGWPYAQLSVLFRGGWARSRAGQRLCRYDSSRWQLSSAFWLLLIVQVGVRAYYKGRLVLEMVGFVVADSWSGVADNEG